MYSGKLTFGEAFYIKLRAKLVYTVLKNFNSLFMVNAVSHINSNINYSVNYTRSGVE